jgi:outer membrane protein TolC
MKRFWLVLLVFLMASFDAATARAQSSELRLEDVLSSIERDHPLVGAAREERNLARGDRTAADGAFDTTWRTRAFGTPLGYYRNVRADSLVEQPTALWGATVFGGYRIGRGEIPDYDGKQETNDLGELRAGFVLPTLRNGPIDRRRASRERGELGEKIGDKTLAVTTLDVKRLGGIRYWDWVAQGKKRDIAKSLLEAAIRRDEQIAARVERGDVPPIERTENERAILQRRAQLVAQERALQLSAIELSQLYRDERGNPVVPDASRLPRLDEPSSWPGEGFDSAVERAAVNRPDLARFSLARRQAEVEHDFAKNQRLPALDFQLAISKDLGQGLASRRPVELEVGLVLEVPLQNRVASGRAEAARAALARIAMQERAAKDRVSADVRDARSAMELGRQRLEVARREVTVSAELERAEWAKFAAGDGTLLLVNLREQATFDARLREVDALAECQRALVLYRAATADLR